MTAQYTPPGEACDSMAGGEQAGGSSGLLIWIFLSSGVTCAAILYDVVQRYMVKKPSDDEAKKNGGVTDQVTTELKLSINRLHEIEKDRKNATKLEKTEREKEREKERASLVALTDTITKAAQAPVQASVVPSTRSSGPPPKRNEDGLDEADSGSSSSSSGGVGGEYGLRWLLGSLVDVIRSTVRLTPPTEDISEECAQQLDGIAQLEEPCNSLSVEFDKCAVLLSKRDDEGEETAAQAEGEDDNNLVIYQKRLVAVRSQWSGVRRLFYCIDVHLKNAADYQQFFFELRELQKIFDRFNAELTADLSKDVVHMQGMDALKDFQANTQATDAPVTMKNLRLWDATMARLDEVCRNIVPVHMRTQPIEEPLTARALCSYRKDELSVSEGDIITLENNDDKYEWKVSTMAGVSGILPAVAVLIPPPDALAQSELSRLRQSLREAYVALKIQFQRKLLTVATDVISDILDNKRHCIAVIHPENKKKMLADLESIKDTFNIYYDNDEDWPPLEDKIEELIKLITDAKEEGEEAECLKEVMDMISTLNSISTEYKTFVTTLESHKSLNVNKVEKSPAGSEWDTLDELEQAKRDMSLGVKVRRESAQIGEASTYESASGETRSTFSIKAVLDTRDYSQISMSEAIRKGIVDQQRGMYINPKTHDEIPIPTAMTQGFIIVESTETRQTRELKQAVGLVTVKYTRETRPYSVKAIMDPRTDTKLSVSKAIEEGVYDSDRERWCNPDTGEEMSVENAIDCGGFIVEYDAEAEVNEPEVSEKTFAVFGVLDRKEGKRLPFHEAAEKGLIDKQEGVYYDTLSGTQMHVVEAFKKNYVRGRVIEDPKQLELYLSEGFNLNRSRDSSFSDT